MEPGDDPELQFHETYVLDKDVHFRYAYKTLIPFFIKAWNEFQCVRPHFLPQLSELKGTEHE